jgi:hypothetical protein
MTDAGTSTPASHWRRRANSVRIPHDQAVRQGDITRLAFEVLGKDHAIAFLNGESPRLHGRPIALATESIAGQASVVAELERMRGSQLNRCTA